MLIYDALGNLKSTEWLLAKYGQVTLNGLPASAPSWRVFALVEDADYERSESRSASGADPGQKPATRPSWWPKPAAAAALVAKVLSEAGEPLAQIPVARHWPDAPQLPPGQQHWKKRGVIGETNGEGDVGFGMGNGDYYTPPQQAGVSWIWVAQPDVASEAVSGLGMLAGTNHSHMNVVFRYDSLPPEPPPPDDELIQHVKQIDDTVTKIHQLLVTMRIFMERLANASCKSALSE